MAKKKAKRIKDEKASVQEIYRKADYIEELARMMYDSGEGVSITKIYHRIKGPLGLAGNYSFACGDAIKGILREAGWDFGVFGGRL